MCVVCVCVCGVCTCWEEGRKRKQREFCDAIVWQLALMEIYVNDS